jgi:Copper chaperone
MKSNRIFLSLAILFLMVAGAGSLVAQDKKKNDKEVVVFLVEKMHCDNCKATIEKYISFEKGVKDLNVDLANKLVTIAYDPKKTNPEKLQEGFRKIKFPAVISPMDAQSAATKKE